jgi:glycosyltransferase involved in cell wall biosynthesis
VGQERDLTVFYYKTDGSGQRWDVESAGGGNEFQEKMLFSFTLGPFVIFPTLPYHLWKGDFDEVVGTSDTCPVLSMLFALPIILFRDIELTTWTEDIDTEYRYNRYRQQSLAKHFLATLFWIITRTYQSYLYKLSSKVVAYSDLARDAAIQRGANPVKIRTSPQTIDPSILSPPDSDLDAERGDPTVLFLGTIEPRKGIGVLINSLDDLPDSANLWIAGEGPLREEIESETDDEHIEVFGRVDEETKTALLQESDVLVLPSRHEPWGIVVLEALACGTPAVTTSAAGVAMILNDSAVVEPGNAEELAKAILYASNEQAPEIPSLDEMADPLITD